MKTLQVTRVLIPIIVVLMIATAIFTPVLFFIHNSIEQSCVENNMNSVGSKKIPFNYCLWHKMDVETLLTGILTSAAAIVAVAFTITQYTISDIIKRYTPRILDVYTREVNFGESFILLMFVVGLSAASLFLIDALEEWVALVILLIIVEVFLYSLILFAKSFELLFMVMYPITFLTSLKDMTMENIKNNHDNA